VIHSALLEGAFDSTAFITVYKKKLSNKDQDIFLLMSKTNKKNLKVITNVVNYVRNLGLFFIYDKVGISKWKKPDMGKLK
jgi:hypothetical protein